MTKQPFNNNFTPHERRAELRKSGATYSTFATSEADVVGGRYAAQTKSTVTGSSPAPQYPKGANWSQDQLPDEAPLGVAIDEMVPVGEAHEIEASLRDANDGAGFSPPNAADSASPDEVSRPAESLTIPAAGAPSSHLRRKRKRK